MPRFCRAKNLRVFITIPTFVREINHQFTAMKALRYFFLLLALTFAISESFAYSRFFKANSVRIKYVWYETQYAPFGTSTESASDIMFAEMWTGNDTIVDGYSCVTLWDQDEGKAPVLIGFIREDENGYVWRYYLDYDKFLCHKSDPSHSKTVLEYFGLVNDWAFLYDFSNPDWKEGTSLETSKWLNPKAHRPTDIYKIYQTTAENGDTLLAANDSGGPYYGVGYPNYAFENFVVFQKFVLYDIELLEYWRDGELLLKNWQIPDDVLSYIFSYTTNIEPATSSSSEADSYDLQGRPVDGTQRGVLIRNGKKMLVK